MAESTQSRGARNASKELAFALLLGCGYVEGRDALLRWRRRCQGVVLTYHRIGKPDTMTRSPDAFRTDLAFLSRRFECMTLSDLVARIESGQHCGRPLAAVTFDDGYRDNFTEAVPLLRAAGVPATFFVATGFVGTERDFPHDLRGTQGSASPPRFAKLTWDDLREMQAGGFEIGSHTIGHTDLGRCDRQTVTSELEGSLELLNGQLGTMPRALAYPWGKAANLPRNAAEVVAAAGYYAAVTTMVGGVAPGCERYLLPRIDVGNGAISVRGFRARVCRVPGVGVSDDRG